MTFSRSALRKAVEQARAWLKDNRGVAAVEFALIVPLLLTMYLVTLEVGQGIETDKKVGRISSIVGDLVTQESQVTKADLDAILKIGAAIIQPYGRSKPSIVITGIQMTDVANPVANVVWRRQLVGTTFSGTVTTGETTTVPSAIKLQNTFLVRVDTTLAYKPVITYSASDQQTLGISAPLNNITMKETYYMRARMSPKVECTDC